jgi:hypothetical protein
MHSLLAGQTKKVGCASRVASKGHADFNTFLDEGLGNVRPVPLLKESYKRVLVLDHNNTDRLQPTNRLYDDREPNVL